MLQLGNEADFTAEVFEDVLIHKALMGDFERDANPFDGVHRLINRRESADAQRLLNAVLPKLLTGSDHVLFLLRGHCRSGWRGCVDSNLVKSEFRPEQQVVMTYYIMV